MHSSMRIASLLFCFKSEFHIISDRVQIFSAHSKYSNAKEMRILKQTNKNFNKLLILLSFSYN